jgi:hypothetical protein
VSEWPRNQLNYKVSGSQDVGWLVTGMAQDVEDARLLVRHAEIKMDCRENATKA